MATLKTDNKTHWLNPTIHGSKSACNLELNYSDHNEIIVFSNTLFKMQLNSNSELCCKECVVKYNENLSK